MFSCRGEAAIADDCMTSTICLQDVNLPGEVANI
jgi:hypothetical protein